MVASVAYVVDRQPHRQQQNVPFEQLLYQPLLLFREYVQQAHQGEVEHAQVVSAHSVAVGEGHNDHGGLHD